MADLLATLFRFRLFVFKVRPFLLAAWFGLAVTTGLITVAQRKGIDLKVSSSSILKFRPLLLLWRFLLLLLWQPGGKMQALVAFSGLLLFSLTASVPTLVVTSLIGTKAVLLRLLLTAFYTLPLSQLINSVISRKRATPQEPQTAVETLLPSLTLNDSTSALPSQGLGLFAQATWKSFSSQVNRALGSIIIGFILASALTIFIPASVIRSWLGEGNWQGPYLAALLATPFQLTGDAEVFLSSTLLVKGASLGTVLSIMLVGPSTIFLMLHRLYQSRSFEAITLYLSSPDS